MQRVGSRAQVMHGNAKMTGGGLKKKDLKYNKQGKIVSKKMSQRAKKEKRLQKAGYTTVKGQFGAFNLKGGMVGWHYNAEQEYKRRRIQYNYRLKQQLKNAALNLAQYKIHIYKKCVDLGIFHINSFLKLFQNIFSITLIKTGLIKNIGNNKDVFNLDEMEKFYDEFNNFCEKYEIEKTESSYEDFKTKNTISDIKNITSTPLLDPFGFN